MQPLEQWIAAHAERVEVASDRVDPVGSSAEAYGEGDRSIFAQTDVPVGTVLVTLKSGAYLNGSTWLARLLASKGEGDTGRKLSEELSALQLSPTLLTTLALLHECSRGQESDFHGYLAQLPANIPLPMTWESEARAMLKHTAAFPIIDRELVLSMYSRFVEPLTKQFPTLWPTEQATLARFLWAYTVVSSRAFTIADGQEPTLLPVIDMANHDAEEPAAQIQKTGSGFQLSTLRAVAKGEAVTISYGELSNAQLLCRYGFVLPTPVASDSIRISSSELSAAFGALALANRDVEEEDDVDEDVRRGGKSLGKGKGKARAKRQKVAAPQDEDAADALFFLLHGDAEREFGLGEALLSFVLGAQLPAEQLYDALAQLLREKDKRYSDALAQAETHEQAEAGAEAEASTAPAVAVRQLSAHERQVCRRILLGLMTLEEDSSEEEDEEDEDEE